MHTSFGKQINRQKVLLVAARTTLIFWAMLTAPVFPCAQAGTLPVTSTADDNGPGTLRSVLAAANSGDTIDATSVSGTITLTNGELVISNSVSIIGPGSGLLTISGNNSNRVF